VACGSLLDTYVLASVSTRREASPNERDSAGVLATLTPFFSALTGSIRGIRSVRTTCRCWFNGMASQMGR
jgi:hypothetical protein